MICRTCETYCRCLVRPRLDEPLACCRSDSYLRSVVCGAEEIGRLSQNVVSVCILHLYQVILALLSLKVRPRISIQRPLPPSPSYNFKPGSLLRDPYGLAVPSLVDLGRAVHSHVMASYTYDIRHTYTRFLLSSAHNVQIKAASLPLDNSLNWHCQTRPISAWYQVSR